MATPPTITGLEPEEVRGDVNRMLPPLEKALRANAACLARGLTLADNVQAYIREVDFKVPDEWADVTMATNWGSGGAGVANFGWRRGDDGDIHCRGTFTWTGGGAPAANTIVATVPGWAPAFTVALHGYAAGGVSIWTIDTLGVLRFIGGVFTGVFTEGSFSWQAADRKPYYWADPLILECPVPWRPAYVQLLGARYSGERTRRITGAWKVFWREVAQAKAGVRQLEIQRVLGLVPTQVYTLAVGVFPE